MGGIRDFYWILRTIIDPRSERQEIAAATVTKKPEVIDLSKLCGRQKVIGGSMSDDWNNMVADQTTRTLWFFENSVAEQIQRDRRATVEARRRASLGGMSVFVKCP
jgi:hypothetical protein